MSSCDPFEMAIEQELSGELPEDQREPLRAHLAICADCREYERSARAQREIIGARADSISKEVDWARLELGVHGSVRREKLSLVFGVAAGVSAALVSAWGFSNELVSPLTTGLLAAGEISLVLLARAYFVFRRARAVAKLAGSGELLAYHRAYLAKRLRHIRALRWIALAVALTTVILTVSASTLRTKVAYALLGGLVAGVWLYTLLVRVPRLRRELRDVDHTSSD